VPSFFFSSLAELAHSLVEYVREIPSLFISVIIENN
jgi:hypothetical protein